MDYLVKRMKEPSTWAGMGLLFTGIGRLIGGDYSTDVVVQIWGGLAAILVSEKK
jgi:hypothetical protein